MSDEMLKKLELSIDEHFGGMLSAHHVRLLALRMLKVMKDQIISRDKSLDVAHD